MAQIFLLYLFIAEGDCVDAEKCDVTATVNKANTKNKDAVQLPAGFQLPKSRNYEYKMDHKNRGYFVIFNHVVK